MKLLLIDVSGSAMVGDLLSNLVNRILFDFDGDVAAFDHRLVIEPTSKAEFNVEMLNRGGGGGDLYGAMKLIDPKYDEITLVSDLILNWSPEIGAIHINRIRTIYQIVSGDDEYADTWLNNFFGDIDYKDIQVIRVS